MRSIDGRLSKLEHRLGITSTAPRYLLIVMDSGAELGPAHDAYIRSLEEAGAVRPGGFGVIDLTRMPDRSAVNHAPAQEITGELL
jgi:hypothetical protein